VQEAQGYIAEGQVFQIVVAQRFALPAVASALDIYRILQALNPSPYAYLLRLPGFEYLGSSPETFVKCANGQVLLRAIAGTRRRGRDEAEDALMAEELQQCEKELAEHHMLVDLGRNDLGRVCRVGSVKPGALAQLVKYTHVMHLATEISGQLAPDKNCFDVFRSCFPRGTVSGAPKVRAMELLSRLEKERRGVYSGVVGYFDFRGNIDGAIAIRSALIKDGVAHVTAGAGVVFDSVPHEEYLETRNKARSVLQSIAAANTLAKGGQLA
jgi:anthranilate synthase component 1